PGYSRRARSLAIHLDLGCDSRDSIDHHPAFPAGVTNLEAEKARGNPQAAQHCRYIQTRAEQDHAGVDVDGCGQLCRGFRCDSTAPPDRSGFAGSEGSAQAATARSNRNGTAHSGTRGPDRAFHTRFVGGTDPQPEKAVATLSGPRIDSG